MKRKSGARESLAVSAVLAAALFLLPLVCITPARETLFGREEPEPPPPPFESGAADGERLLKVLDGETVAEMDLGTYLVGVLRAEMPASFPAEALKAQAVAARTYTCYQLESGSRHENADICTDHTCCQAYLDEETARTNWGGDANTYEEKIRSAVKDTDGEVMLYDAQPILAVFHSSSAGLTRAAGEVWLSDLPYLQAVESPEDTASIPNYYSRLEVSAADLKAKFLAAFPEMDFSGDVSNWLTRAVTDSAGSVGAITVGGRTIKGTQVRSTLGLRSACFTWELQGDTFIFYVTGYGHGVGLSQYGAAAMAESGADYKDILTHYYSGVEVSLPEGG
ncbi:MAG: stage II sporulation protein D [Oscillibacter sp.]|nr:stage II sporulation protein D [Oscillibacter sp.]